MNRTIGSSDACWAVIACLLVLLVAILIVFRVNLFGTSFRESPDADSMARLHRIECE